MAERKTAFAVAAAFAGAGFASGREIVTFFTMHGKWWPLGAIFCCTAAGLLTAMIAALAKRTGSGSIVQLFTRVMDERCGEAVQAVYALLLLIVSAAMCSAAAEMGALAFPLRVARPLGALCALIPAVWSAHSRERLAGGGAIAAGALFLFYCALCAAEPVQPGPAQQNGAMVSAGLGILYACLNMTLAAGVVCSAAKEIRSCARAGLFTGILLFVLLLPACIALSGMGATELALASVAMAGEMGPAGFWGSLLALFAAAVTTLSCCLFSLKNQLKDAGLGGKWCMGAAAAGAVMLSAVGFAPIVDVGYPLLGFVCAMVLPALAIFLKE